MRAQKTFLRSLRYFALLFLFAVALFISILHKPSLVHREQSCVRAEELGTLKSSRTWKSGIQFEIDHHRKWTCGESCYGPFEGWFAYERETKLAGLPVEPHRSRICQVLGRVYGQDTIKSVRLMLDHGAGPFTNLGKEFTCPQSSNVKVSAQVIAVDPLAPHYNSILNEFKIYNTLRSAYCASENLVACIGEGVADFSIIINALDHSINPLEGFLQSMRAVRVGGTVCVYSIQNESERQGATGFHQWNFEIDENSHWLIKGVGSLSSEVIDVTRHVSRFAEPIDTSFLSEDPEKSAVPADHMFICFLRKSKVLN